MLTFDGVGDASRAAAAYAAPNHGTRLGHLQPACLLWLQTDGGSPIESSYFGRCPNLKRPSISYEVEESPPRLRALRCRAVPTRMCTRHPSPRTVCVLYHTIFPVFFFFVSNTRNQATRSCQREALDRQHTSFARDPRPPLSSKKPSACCKPGPTQRCAGVAWCLVGQFCFTSKPQIDGEAKAVSLTEGANPTHDSRGPRYDAPTASVQVKP